MAHLRADECKQALGMLCAGMSTRNVANNFNCNHSTIVRLRQWFLATNTGADRPRPGPRFTKGRKTYDHLLTNLRPFHKTCRNVFAISDLRLVVLFVLRYESRSIFPGRAPIR